MTLFNPSSQNTDLDLSTPTAFLESPLARHRGLSFPLVWKICDTFYGTVEKQRFGKWLKRLIEEKHVSFRSTDQRSVDWLFPVCKLLKINGERGRNRTFNLLIKSQISPIACLSRSHIQSITYKVLRAQRNACKCLKRWSCLAMYSHNCSHTGRSRFLSSLQAVSWHQSFARLDLCAVYS